MQREPVPAGPQRADRRNPNGAAGGEQRFRLWPLIVIGYVGLQKG
jgi:hypothetical protein